MWGRMLAAAAAAWPATGGGNEICGVRLSNHLYDDGQKCTHAVCPKLSCLLPQSVAEAERVRQGRARGVRMTQCK